MTRDEIIRMAREQGLPETATEGVFVVNSDDLGRMLAAEREACAKACEELAETVLALQSGKLGDTSDVLLRHHAVAAKECAAVIRARGVAGGCP